MIFHPLTLDGAFVLQPEPHCDERGFFARLLCSKEFALRGLVSSFEQVSVSYNVGQGTLRGLHLQLPPYAETKVVQCVRGAIFDVLVDLRPGSHTYAQWLGVELTERNRHAAYIPRGFAHGFQTLADESEVHYHITPSFVADACCGLRWDDPELGITWPQAAQIISVRDRNLPLLHECHQTLLSAFGSGSD